MQLEVSKSFFPEENRWFITFSCVRDALHAQRKHRKFSNDEICTNNFGTNPASAAQAVVSFSNICYVVYYLRKSEDKSMSYIGEYSR